MRFLSWCVPLLAFVLTSCDDIEFHGSSDRYREDFHYAFDLSNGGRLQLENFNGSVDIMGWEKNTVEINGTMYASTETRLKEMKIDVTPSASSITVRTVPPLDRRGGSGARYMIRVPLHAELAGITSSNGSIKVEAVEGAARLRTSNGSIHAERMKGSLDAQTSNGSITIAEVTGDTTLHSSNGAIRGDARKGRFSATTSNGSITVRLDDPDQNPVRLESSNGRIELTMMAAREVHASTSNSQITLRMPSTIGATVRAHTSNSSITTDFDVSVHGGFLNKHRLEGTIGSGGPLLDLGTSNGGIKILRL